jgi:cysteinyl-tRNA synthetase
MPTTPRRLPALALAFVLTAAGSRADEPGMDPSRSAGRVKALAAVRRFGYQLQKLDLESAARSEADLLVIDPEGDGPRLSRDAVGRLRRKPDGDRRLVLAYLSIGEAEDDRDYWQKAWKDRPPAWLGPENRDWPGNYEVRYWDPDWQRLILGSPAAPLDRILDDGYDGAYLDVVDGYEYWEGRGQAKTRPMMVEWVRKIARHARTRRPDFLIVPQNAEPLARDPDYLAVVDAIGREDLYFDGDRRQDREGVAVAEADLRRFQDRGKPVFLIEYGRRPKTVGEVVRRAGEQGYRALITVRPLDRLIVSP